MRSRSLPLLPILLFLMVFSPALMSCGSASMAERFNEMAAREDSQAVRVIESLGIQQGSTIVDLGAGGGYFSYLLARQTGAQGTVFAVDINPDYLQFIEKESSRLGLPWIRTVQARPDGFDAEEGSLDLIFTRNVYHHLENRVDYFRRLLPLLAPAGRVAIIDYKNDGNFAHLMGHSTDPEIIRNELQKAGYVRVENHTFLEKQSFQIFQKQPGR